MKNYESITDAIADLKSRGYKSSFQTEHFCLYCGDLDLRLDPETFNIDETYRFENTVNPAGSSVVYAISSSIGIKGTMIDEDNSAVANVHPEMASKLIPLPGPHRD